MDNKPLTTLLGTEGIGHAGMGVVRWSARLLCLGEILCDVHPQEFSAADSLHSRAVDGQWGVVNGVSPEVHHNLLCLPHIEGQIVSATPFSQLCHFLSVVRFIVVADETYHCCVISKLDDVVGAELAVQSWVSSVKSSGLSTQPCGAPVLSVVVLEVLWPTRSSG